MKSCRKLKEKEIAVNLRFLNEVSLLAPTSSTSQRGIALLFSIERLVLRSVLLVFRRSMVLFLSLALIGCVSNRPYRTQVVPIPEITAGTSIPSASIPPPTTYKGQRPGIVLNNGTDTKYDLAYIEFDDMGEYWTIGDLTGRPNVQNDSQVERTVRLIQLRQQQREFKSAADPTPKPIAVIAFIHGWKNNASPHDENKDGNLKDFKEVMKALADSDTQRHYIAVFIAWRGQVIPGNIFTSYWNRRGAAMRVGGPSMTEALFRLMFITKPPLAPTEKNKCGTQASENRISVDPVTGKKLYETALPGIDKKEDEVPLPSTGGALVEDRFVIVAHSFGGRVMERALSQPLMALLYERQSQAASCIPVWNAVHPKEQMSLSFQAPADLIAMINSANDSFETKAMIEGMTRMGLASCLDGTCSSGKENEHPLMVSILSDGDCATKKAMPLAQRLSYFGQNLNRKYDKEPLEKGQIDVPKQNTFFFKNEGSIQQLTSHTLVSLPIAQENCKAHLQFWYAQKCFELQAKPPDANHFVNRTPFWVFDVPTAVIPNHTGIFNEGTTALLQMIIRNAMDPTQQLNLKAH